MTALIISSSLCARLLTWSARLLRDLSFSSAVKTVRWLRRSRLFLLTLQSKTSEAHATFRGRAGRDCLSAKYFDWSQRRRFVSTSWMKRSFSGCSCLIWSQTPQPNVTLRLLILDPPPFFQNKTLPIEDTTDCLSTMACVCRVMLETPWVLWSPLRPPIPLFSARPSLPKGQTLRI